MYMKTSVNSVILTTWDCIFVSDEVPGMIKWVS